VVPEPLGIIHLRGFLVIPAGIGPKVWPDGVLGSLYYQLTPHPGQDSTPEAELSLGPSDTLLERTYDLVRLEPADRPDWLGSETKAQVLELRPRASGAPGPAAASPLSCLPGARGQAEARTVMIPITAWARFPASGRCFPPGAAGASRRSGPGPETFPAPKTY
jgi:hypothetical protein